jgi:hypothetical protein
MLIKATGMLANTTQAETNQWPSLLVLRGQFNLKIEMIKIWNETKIFIATEEANKF